MAKQEVGTLLIPEVQTRALRMAVVGRSPLILNRVSQKAARELLLPKGRKTAADKAASLKHEPLHEFRAAPYTINDETAPTLLAMPATAFKGCMMVAALDLPGAKKAQIGRLTYVEGEMIGVFGVPFLFMTIVRSADFQRTPDVRTRAILPRWAAIFVVRFVTPLLRESSVANLLAAGGVTAGIGDWRVEKGAGSYGRFALAQHDDPELQEIMQDGRAAQIKGMEAATPYDAESAELLEWYSHEVRLRGHDTTPTRRRRREVEPTLDGMPVEDR
jgi:hypothetical protein